MTHYISGSSYYKAQFKWQMDITENIQRHDSQKRQEDKEKNEECESSLLLLQITLSRLPRSFVHSLPPPIRLFLLRSFVSESINSLHGYRFPSLSIDGVCLRRRWFSLRSSWWCHGGSGFIRNRFSLTLYSSQGNVTLPLNVFPTLRSSSFSWLSHSLNLREHMIWWRDSFWNL